MFEIEIKSEALSALRKMKSFRAREILDAIETCLRFEPERTSKTRIKRLRGKQRATFRLRVGDHRVFYDVEENPVIVVAILHKHETPDLYAEGENP